MELHQTLSQQVGEQLLAAGEILVTLSPARAAAWQPR